MLYPIFQEARFLIVDDEPANLAVLNHMLQQWEARHIQTTTNPHEALALFESFRPDVVLLDLMMPGLDGFQVMEQLNPLIPDEEFLPILVLTADTSERAKRRALLRGATEFLTKPFDAVELSLRLRHLLERQSLHRRLQNQNQTLEMQVQQRTQQLEQSEIDTVQCWGMAAEYRDDETGQHSQRIGDLSAQLARALGVAETGVQMIQRAAPLHDVGKIGIPDYILLKPDKLTPPEFAVMKTHTSIGATILARHRTPLLQQAATIALTHHERFDGDGYPQGLSGENIPQSGRIVALADVFDALTHQRPYKEAWPVAEAVAEIQRQSGTQFDPQVVDAFVTVMPSQ